MGNNQMTTKTTQFGIGLVSIFALTLAACGGSGSDGSAIPVGDQSQPPPPVTEPPPPSGDTGIFNLSVSDSPIKDAAKVCIRFDGVELKHADSGDIVVALVEGQEATLKRFRRNGSMIALEAANPAYETRVYRDDQVRVQGRLVGLILREELEPRGEAGEAFLAVDDRRAAMLDIDRQIGGPAQTEQQRARQAAVDRNGGRDLSAKPGRRDAQRLGGQPERHLVADDAVGGRGIQQILQSF